MPLRVNQWNYTDRGGSSVYNDHYRGIQNTTYTTQPQRSNQGYYSSKCKYPQGSFSSCRYGDEKQYERTANENNWHPDWIDVSTPSQSYTTADAVTLRLQHNTLGTNPLPIPFEQREKEAQETAAREAELVKTLNKNLGPAAPKPKNMQAHIEAGQNRGSGTSTAPLTEHTIYAPTHLKTQIRPNQIYRPSAHLLRQQAANEAIDAEYTRKLERYAIEPQPLKQPYS